MKRSRVLGLLGDTWARVTVVVIGLALFAVYAALDARGGPHTNLLGPSLLSFSVLAHKEGIALLVADLVADAVLALASAVLMTSLLASARQGRREGKPWGAVGVLAVAGATFGCPTCTIPLAGSFGLAIFGSALPLGGLEFKLLALVVVGVALYRFERRLCRVQDGSCQLPATQQP
ncbi:MAG: hypothetical protein ACYDH5_16890 [Acidimicrobiales bacterium]